MNDPGFGQATIIQGLIILLVAPFLVLTTLGIFVFCRQPAAAIRSAQTDVWPPVVLPWSQTAYNITFTGRRAKPSRFQNKPVDMLFVMDVSGSMAPLLGTFSNIAHDLARQLEVQKAGQIRFALVQFGDNSQFSRNGPAKPSDFHDGLD